MLDWPTASVVITVILGILGLITAIALKLVQLSQKRGNGGGRDIGTRIALLEQAYETVTKNQEELKALFREYLIWQRRESGARAKE